LLKTIKGTPLGKVIEAGLACFDDFSTPEPCSECRQLKRWSQKMLAWRKDQSGVFTALVNAIFKADDDILKAFCGHCYLVPPEEQSCECVCFNYQSLGYSLDIPVSMQPYCGNIFQRVLIEGCIDWPCFDEDCFDPSCFAGLTKKKYWLKDCLKTECCEIRTLDPCGSADDLEFIKRLIEVRQITNRMGRTGPALMAVLNLLFPGSNPVIVQGGNGEMCIWIGRPMTTAEWQMRDFLKSLLPVSPFVTINFVFEP